MDVQLRTEEIAYGAYLLDQHFGPICARIAALMLCHGTTDRLTLRELCALVNDPKWDTAGPTLVVPKLSTLCIRASLVVLIQHQCVIATTRPAREGKLTYLYRAQVEGILSRGRFAHYVEAAVSDFGKLGAHVLSEVLQHGSICPDAITLPEDFASAQLDDVVARMRKERWIRVLDLDPTQRGMIEGHTGALAANYTVLNIVLARSLLEKIVEDELGPVSGLIFSALFQVVVSVKDATTHFTPQPVKEIMPFVHGHLNMQEVTDTLRAMHSDNCLAGMVTTTSKEIVEKVSVSAEPESSSTRKRKASTPPMKVRNLESKKMTEAFCIDWKAVKRKLRREFSRKVVRQQFGVHAARVYAVLDDNCEKMYEVGHISDLCLLTPKQVCVILNQLTMMNLVFWQEIPKGQHSAQCTPANVPNYGAGIWAYRTNQEKCSSHFRSLMAKCLHNLLLRFKDEVECRVKIPSHMDRVALDSAQDILERTFLHLQLSYLAIRL